MLARAPRRRYEEEAAQRRVVYIAHVPDFRKTEKTEKHMRN